MRKVGPVGPRIFFFASLVKTRKISLNDSFEKVIFQILVTWPFSQYGKYYIGSQFETVFLLLLLFCFVLLYFVLFFVCVFVFVFLSCSCFIRCIQIYMVPVLCHNSFGKAIFRGESSWTLTPPLVHLRVIVRNIQPSFRNGFLHTNTI